MKPKILLLFIVLLTTINASAKTFDFSAENEDGVTIYYKIMSNNTGLCVTYKEYSTASYSGTVVIPENVSKGNITYPVVAILENAFQNCTDLISVTIPNSVTRIENYAFSGCVSLTGLNIGNSVTSIGKYVFRNCSSLASVTIPNSVMKIDDCTFDGCTNLASVTIPNSVTSIGKSAFNGCSRLTSVSIPNSVTSIGSYAFHGCTGLKTLKIEDGDTELRLDNKYGNFSFDGCELENLYVGRNLYFWTWKELCFTSSLKTVDIGNTVTSIAMGAFSNCTCLTSVTIPNSVTEIGNDAFKNCAALTSVTIGNSVTSIGDAAFRECSALTSIIIPNQVTEISSEAFYHCTKLSSLTIGNSVTSIGNIAFAGCISLTTVTIPASVSKIGNAAFNSCSSLKEVILSDGNTPIEFGTWVFYPNPIETLYVGRDFIITSDEGYPFKQLYTLNSLTFGNTVTSIPSYAFYGCSALISVIIPNSVNEIGGRAFAYCTELTSVSIGNSVKTIGDGVFSECKNLNTIKIPDSVTSIGQGIISGTAIYDNESNWEDGLLYVSGWLVGAKSYRSDVIIKDGTKGIAPYLFSELYYTNKYLTSVTIPNSVQFIGQCAFQGCTGLNAFYGKFATPDNRCLIADGTLIAFAPYGMNFYDIPDNVSTIGRNAFVYCKELESVTIPNSVITIMQSAFLGCTGLTSITIPNSVTEMGNGAFCGCNCLTKASLGDSLTTIGYEAFYGCSALSSVSLGKSVKDIEEGAFKNCKELKLLLSKNITPPNCHYEVFSSTTFETATLYVLKEGLESYKAANTWKSFFNIIALTEEELNTLGISTPSINDYCMDGKAYNLNGMEVNDDYRGIVIKNGKKFMNE